MNKDIAFVMPYFGSFKPSISLFFEGVRRNPQIDWLVFTDNDPPQNLPRNVNWIKTTLKEVESLALEKLGCEVNIKTPYKLCDLKPLYGAVFSDYLGSYEYWGYGDFDVVYGGLYDYLNKIGYSGYDRINRWGHCALVKNCDEMNFICFSEKALGIFDVHKVLVDGERNYGFDEVSFNTICFESGVKMYVNSFQADIDIFYERMRCVDKKTMTKLCKVENVTYAPKNYAEQIFVCLGGRVFRLYIKSGRAAREEFAYIHFRKEVPIYLPDSSCDTFIISRTGFYPFDGAKADDSKYVSECIKKYNSQEKLFVERLEHTALWKPLAAVRNSGPVKKILG